MTDGRYRFPAYTRAERALDNAVHLIGLPAALAAVAWLLALACDRGSFLLVGSVAVYAVGLLGMLAASAAYHLTPPGPRKEVLRRLDHAMIFVMIAGTYTPFALNALAPIHGPAVCAAMWTAAGIGVVLKLAMPRRFERLGLLRCLVMGWAVVGFIPALAERLPRAGLHLLFAGGLAYTLGAALYTRNRWRFHTAGWHILVLVGAGLHVGAVRIAFLAG
jgi:hemolysin III